MADSDYPTPPDPSMTTPDLPTSASLSITHDKDYRFVIDFGAGIPELQVDEPRPIGHGEGPGPEQMLLAGVANCLCASLFFALTKFRQDARGLRADATCAIERNDNGRLRITAIEVDIAFDARADELQHLERALSRFEDFCTVSESIKQGIPVEVRVRDGDGTQLK